MRAHGGRTTTVCRGAWESSIIRICIYYVSYTRSIYSCLLRVYTLSKSGCPTNLHRWADPTWRRKIQGRGDDQTTSSRYHPSSRNAAWAGEHPAHTSIARCRQCVQDRHAILFYLKVMAKKVTDSRARRDVGVQERTQRLGKYT